MAVKVFFGTNFISSSEEKLNWFMVLCYLCLIKKNFVLVHNMVFSIDFVFVLFFIFLFLYHFYIFVNRSFFSFITAIVLIIFLLFLYSSFHSIICVVFKISIRMLRQGDMETVGFEHGLLWWYMRC